MALRRTLLVAVLVGALLGLTACEPVRVGARCRGNGFGESGETVAQCRNGRWVAFTTKGEVAKLYLKIFEAKRAAVGEVVRPGDLGAPNVPNTADPSVFVENGVSYVYGTSNFHRVPVRALGVVDGISAGQFDGVSNAMPGKPWWTSDNQIWAPTVAHFGPLYVMYFGANRLNPPDPGNAQCIGRAVATSPLGPFAPDLTPAYCGTDGVKGALDPSIFVRPDGQVQLLFAMGGSSTNIWTIPLDAAGTIVGTASALLTRNQPWEDWFLENPSMYFDGSTYLLAYSAGRWDTAGYQTGIARCSGPTGPCTARSDGPWLSSLRDRVGPGGLEFFRGADGQPRVVFHTYPSNNVSPVGARSTHIRRVAFDPWPRIV